MLRMAHTLARMDAVRVSSTSGLRAIHQFLGSNAWRLLLHVHDLLHLSFLPRFLFFVLLSVSPAERVGWPIGVDALVVL